MQYPQLNVMTSVGPQAKIATNYGDILIQLFEEQAPLTVENFVRLAMNKYYDGLTFHRVIDNFMIQGGDPEGEGTGGTSIWGHPFEDEFASNLFNLRGALSMANAGPKTNGSQFFIVQNPKVPAKFIKQLREAKYPEDIIKAYEKQGGAPWLDLRHTVFGQVVAGMDVVDKIAKVKTDKDGMPKMPVTIYRIDIQGELDGIQVIPKQDDRGMSR